MKEKNWNIGTLKEHLEARIDSNDRRYQESFENSKVAVKDALAAQKELTNNAFNSSEKAIVKAEDAQRDYNERSNEFRGQLDDQAQTLMPRTEVQVLFNAVNEKIFDLGKKIDATTTRITTIESRGDGKTQMWQYIVMGISVLMGVAGIISYILAFKK